MFGTEPAIVRQFPNYALEYRAQAAEPEGHTDRIVSDSGDWSGNLYDFYRLVQERLYGPRRWTRCGTPCGRPWSTVC